MPKGYAKRWARAACGLIGLTIGTAAYAGFVAYLDAHAAIVRVPETGRRQVIVWGRVDVDTASLCGLAVPTLLAAGGAIAGGGVRWAPLRHPLTTLALAVVAAAAVACAMVLMFHMASHWASRLLLG